MEFPADSPAGRAMRDLPSGRAPKSKAGCKCAACSHCRRDHEKADGPCLECPCKGFL
jgi:hypothetical protein